MHDDTFYAASQLAKQKEQILLKMFDKFYGLGQWDENKIKADGRIEGGYSGQQFLYLQDQLILEMKPIRTNIEITDNKVACLFRQEFKEFI